MSNSCDRMGLFSKTNYPTSIVNQIYMTLYLKKCQCVWAPNQVENDSECCQRQCFQFNTYFVKYHLITPRS